jgi:Ca2+-binding RTX toxin-like protein
MATITVPGANSTTVTTTYTGSSNSVLAQSVANTLAALFSTGQLTVSSVAGGGTVPPPSPTTTNQLVISSGGAVTVPPGYLYTVDDSEGAPLVVTGATNFLGGDGNINLTSSGGSIVTGNGNDLFNLSGAYSVAAGSGADAYNLAGTGQVSLGGGLSSINIVTGADTIFAGTSPGVTGVNGHTGSVFFYAGAATTNTPDFIAGGSGGDTIVGAPNNIIIYANAVSASGASAPGALLVAGAGSETIYGAPSTTKDVIYGSYSGDANDLLWAGSGNDALVAGSGNQTLVGGLGTDTFYVANPSLLSSIAKTTITPGKDTFYLTHSGDNLALVGYDTLYGGASGSQAAAKAVSSALTAGSSAVTLKDGTSITFVGSTTGLHIVSS